MVEMTTSWDVACQDLGRLNVVASNTSWEKKDFDPWLFPFVAAHVPGLGSSIGLRAPVNCPEIVEVQAKLFEKRLTARDVLDFREDF